MIKFRATWHLYSHYLASLQHDPIMKNFDVSLYGDDFYPLLYKKANDIMSLKTRKPTCQNN